MSFYGNMTSQLSQAFSRFLFKNNGKDKQDFQEGEDKVLDASHSSASVTFDSGNRWIQIQGGDDGCKIWHGAPATNEDDLTLVSGFIQTEKPPEPSHLTQLNSGDYLQVPLLFYDDAGHVSTTGEAVYYRLPVIAIESDIETVKTQVSNMQTTVTGQNTKISQVEQKMSVVTNDLDTLEANVGEVGKVTNGGFNDLSTAIGDVTKLKALFDGDVDQKTLVDSLIETIKELRKTCDSQAEQIASLRTSLTTLNDLVHVYHPTSES